MLHGLICAALGAGSISVTVPATLDRLPYVVLQIAAQCGFSAPLRPLGLLDVPSQRDVLSGLDDAMRGRPLVVTVVQGTRGPRRGDPELQNLYSREHGLLYDWLSEKSAVFIAPHAASPRSELRPRAATEWDATALWRYVLGDPELYSLAVVRARLKRAAPDELGWEPADIVDDIWRALPLSLRDVLAVLATHGRPVFRSLLVGARLTDSAALDRARSLDLVELIGDQVSLPRHFVEHAPIPDDDRRGLHRKIANALAPLAQDSHSSLAGIATLEAHRHFASIPDLAKAREFARFGVASLLEAARRDSRAQGYDRAAETYNIVLQIDKDAQSAGSEGIGARARGYALHYQHYNAYKSDREGIDETLRGYDQSIAQWPENALFWSRAVVSRFLLDRQEEAFKKLSEAWERVPEHPDRHRWLTARTAEHLARRGHALDAAHVWGDHSPEDLSQQEILDDLLKSLHAGVETRRLWAPGIAPIVFQHGVVVTLVPRAPGFRCGLLDRQSDGATRTDAIRNALIGLRAEFERLVEATGAEESESRVRLLDAIDVRASWSATDESSRWTVYLASLDAMEREGQITRLQREGIRDVWRRCRGAVAGLRRPAAGRDADGNCYLAWSYEDIREHAVDVEFSRDGAVSWFYRNRRSNDLDEVDDAGREPPGGMIAHLRNFAR